MQLDYLLVDKSKTWFQKDTYWFGYQDRELFLKWYDLS